MLEFLKEIIKKYSTRFVVYFVVAMVVSFGTLKLSEHYYGQDFLKTNEINALLIIVVGAIIGGITSLTLVKENTIVPHNIAIIGYPKSGKTTLIVSLFQEIFSRKIAGINATLKGESTIERLNEQISRKESGLPVGPTTDQTMFAYRTIIQTRGRPFGGKEYRVEFGDYPGEYSRDVTDNNYFEKLKKSEYFKWCIEANAYIFIVDVGRYILEKDKKQFIATQSKSIRESWQRFVEFNPISRFKISKKPIVLVFNKMDLFEIDEKNRGNSNVIEELGFSSDIVPKVFPLNDGVFSFYSELMEKEFRDIILYLKSESNKFHILYTSNFGTINDRFAGVNDILKFILPNKLTF